MNLPFYNAMGAIRPYNPDNYYRSLFQELIDTQWDNTTMLQTILQQVGIGQDEYQKIEIHMNHVLDRSTGVKQGDDFRKLIFKDIEYFAPRGLYYQFDNNYWLTINTDEIDRTSRHTVVRRCNNFIRYRDSYDNHIVEIPCIMEYDTSSPSPQVNNDVITPNNHAVLIVQGNEVTMGVIEDNLRLMFGGRPFKVTGFNNYLDTSLTNEIPYLIYIDAYLDEVSPYDTKEIAFNFPNKYTIELNKGNFENLQGFKTQLKAIVRDRGYQVDREVQWSSSDSSIVTVDNNGNVELIGASGEKAIITAQLGENLNITASIDIGIVAVPEVHSQIIIEPEFGSLSQNQSIIFTANVYIDGVKQSNHVLLTPSGANINNYILEQTGHFNEFKLTNLKLSKMPLLITATSRGLDTHKTWAVELTSMF